MRTVEGQLPPRSVIALVSDATAPSRVDAAGFCLGAEQPKTEHVAGTLCFLLRGGPLVRIATTMVHEVAQVGFDREAETYERSRPTYPPDAVSWLVGRLHLRRGRTVTDVAAGTGKLTRLLLSTGATVVAVEPVEGMREVFRRVVPAVPVVAATAEAMPFRASSMDAATVGQAFHWFDAEAAFAELARVLRPGGGVAMVWNARDRSIEWVDRAWAVMDRVEKKAPWRDHDSVFDTLPAGRSGFEPFDTATFRHEQIVTPEELVDRFRGVSHVAALPPEDQAAILSEVRELLATHPDTRGRHQLRLPYRVDCYWSERR
ncbi:MAG: methyltransferase domain-containing protein [Actinomycetota bacterium]|nr:methyltransferase domain-containing protein [Actinomycetota bacterium]